MSIRARLIVTLLVTLAVALAFFASLSIFAIDYTLRSSLDTNLQTTAQAIAATVDEEKGHPSPDASDVAQIGRLRTDIRAAVLDSSGAHIAGDALPSTAQERDDIRIVSASIVRNGRSIGQVLAWRSNDWIDELDRDALLVSIGVGLLVLAAGAVVAYRVADSIVAPIGRVALLMERIEGRDLSLRVGHIDIAELARLAASFDRMLQRLESAFTRERQFAADASHELRAPLAVVRAEAELALRRERTEQEYRHAFDGVLHEVGRLEALVEDLLAAARADVDAVTKSTVDVGLVARDVVERCAPAARVKNVHLESHDRREKLLVDPLGLERALLAIVHNAIAFAPAGGSVRIDVESVERDLAIVVRDDGAGFSREALENATSRFWRADGSRPRGGTGLGLAIARAIVEANGGALILENAEPHGAKVSLAFPHSL